MEAHAFDLLLRWAHFLGGLIWIGHNYANVVQRPSYRPLQREEMADASSATFMALLNREHGTFRYASVVTWGAGIVMLLQRGWLMDAIMLKGYFAVIGLGMWIGTLMLANLWLVLWPHQKKVLGFVPASLDDRIRCARVTYLSSRINTMLSIPLLFFMAASTHGTAVFS
ncbi:uncharacterized protein NMK_2529 [Novimethylophilus kurashikiensis]|uniref:Urate oxidase N-terminal domain-containing protein n=1 Tax=Novimethylophilus kurashikiensis TaxID=1825523 RepID=A0A2R5FBK2_9PROT|nr:urate hydroxylase PuuD [Novimethylophilus kurashikiensis]GBG14928.1 uncharacterized protein NMK_2529 [Novimethylophilus kurashikiensis]